MSSSLIKKELPGSKKVSRLKTVANLSDGLMRLKYDETAVRKQSESLEAPFKIVILDEGVKSPTIVLYPYERKSADTKAHGQNKIAHLLVF